MIRMHKGSCWKKGSEGRREVGELACIVGWPVSDLG